MKIGIDAINIRGGGITHLKNIINYSRNNNKKFKLIIWCNSEVKVELKTLKHIEIKNYPIFDKNILLRILWRKFFFLKDINKNNCDVMFNLSGDSLHGYKKNIVLFQNVLPLLEEIYTKDTNILDIIRNYLLSKVYKRSYLSSKINIFPSNYCKDLFQKKFGIRDNNFVIYHGVYKNRKIKKIDANNIICVSSLEIFKNIKRLIEALNILQKNKVKFHLSIVGPAKKNQIRNLNLLIEKYKLNKFIKHYGKIDQKKLKSLLHNSKVLVNPSLCESFGLPNIEGYVCGLNILCSDIKVFKETLGNKAFFFNRDSSFSLASKLKFVLKKNKKYKKNLDFIMNKFDWNKSSNLTFKILTNV